MQVYPQHTQILAHTSIRLKRQLPGLLRGLVPVRSGQEVSAVQVVVRSESEQGFFVIDVAEQLNLKADQIEEHLEIVPGARVRIGTPILRVRRRLGSDKYLESPIDGIYEDVQNGFLLIRKAPREEDIRAMMPGWIVQIVPDRGVVIEASGAFVQATWSNNLEGFGKLRVLSTTPGGQPKKDQITAGMQGSIIAVGHISTSQIISDAENYGARGIIAGTIAPAVFHMRDTFSIPVTITDGIGRFPMSRPIFELLQKHNESDISLLSGIYSQQQRPTLIIPSSQTSNSYPPDRPPKPQIGQTARLLVPPLLGKVGKIKAVYPISQLTDSGYTAPGADVQLEDGTVLFIPDANLDIIM